MSTSQILTVVGYAVGTYFGYPQLGAIVGGIVGSQIDAANVSYDVPKVGDLKSPQMQYGGKLPRLYGSNRTSATLAWYSDKRVIAGDGGGKGDDPTGPTPDTAEIDVLYLFSVDSPVIAITRVWKNGKVIWTARADSDNASLIASHYTDAWTSMDFLDGNPAQLPHPTIEASDGVGNVSAYRRRQGAMITGLQLGQSGQMPLIEFEVITKGTSELRIGDGLLCHFDEMDGSDVLSAVGPNLVPVGGASISGTPVFGDGAGLLGTGKSFTASGITGDLTGKKWRIEWWSTLTGSGGEYFSLSSTASAHHFTLTHSGTFAAFVYNFTSNFASEGGQIGDLGFTPQVNLTAHMALQYDGNYTTLFKDGQQVATFGNAPGTWDGVTFDTLVIGAGFEGRIDEVSYCVDIGDSEDWTDGVYYGGYTVPTEPFDATNPGLAWTPGSEDLADVVELEWERVGDASQIDVSDLVGVPVRGFQTAGSVRGGMESLSSVFHFGAACSNKLYFRLMGAAPKATLTFAELAAGEDKPADEPFAPERANEEEIVERVTLTFPDYDNDYNAGTQSGNRGTGTSSIVQASQTNVVMTPSEGKAVAEIAAALAGIGATSGQIALTDWHADKEPTDCLIAPDEDGNLHRIRLVRDNYNPGVHVFDWVLDDPNALVAEGITSGAGGQALTVAPPAVTEILLFDGPIFRDVDDDPGFYAFAKGSRSAKLLNSADGGVTYTEVASFTTPSVFGTCDTVLGDTSVGWVFDETSTVTVNVGVGTLSSTTRDDMLRDQSINACAIGIHGRWEVMQFRTATLVSAGVYTLSGFLRGARGTEWAIPLHEAGEKFVVITTAGRRVEKQASEIGIEESYKGVTAGRPVSSATEVLFTDEAVGLMPFAPVHLRVAESSDGTEFSWTPRTRFATRFASPLGIYAPMGEATESYDVELRDGSDVLVSSDTVSEPAWVAASATVTSSLVAPCWGLRSIGGELVGIRDDLIGAFNTQKGVVRFDTSGVLIAETAVTDWIWNEVYQWTNFGDLLVFAGADFNNLTLPVTYDHSGTASVDRTDLAFGFGLGHFDYPTVGETAGVACDGTDIWVTQRLAGTILKFDPADLFTVVDTFPIEVGIGALYHDSGQLWIVSYSTEEVIVWDIATELELMRFSVVAQPFDLHIVGALVFVHGYYKVGVYDKTTGAEIITHDFQPPFLLPQRTLVDFGSYVVACAIQGAVLLDAATGDYVRTITTEKTLYNVAGANGSVLYLTTGATGESKQTLAYELSSLSLSGYSVTVYQNSAVVGRGYPASLSL